MRYASLAGEWEADSQRVRQLVREGRSRITEHADFDNPEREIFVDDILNALKTGFIDRISPLETYQGSVRYIWLGEAGGERVLRLVITVVFQVVVISAAIANRGEADRYRSAE